MSLPRCRYGVSSSSSFVSLVFFVLKTNFGSAASFGAGMLCGINLDTFQLTYCQASILTCVSFCPTNRALVCCGDPMGNTWVLHWQPEGPKRVNQYNCPTQSDVVSMKLNGLHCAQLHRNGKLHLYPLDSEGPAKRERWITAPLFERLALPGLIVAYNCNVAVCDLGVASSDLARGATLVTFEMPPAFRPRGSRWVPIVAATTLALGVIGAAAAASAWYWAKREP